METERKYTLYVGAFYDVLSLDSQSADLVSMFCNNYYPGKKNYIDFVKVKDAPHLPNFLTTLHNQIGDKEFKNIRFINYNDWVRRRLFVALPDLGLHLSDMVDK